MKTIPRTIQPTRRDSGRVRQTFGIFAKLTIPLERELELMFLERDQQHHENH
jgi:hypothetical protein